MSLFRGAFECQGYLRQFAHFRLQHFEKEKASNRYTYFLTSTMHNIPILIHFSSYFSIAYRVQHTCLQIVPMLYKSGTVCGSHWISNFHVFGLLLDSLLWVVTHSNSRVNYIWLLSSIIFWGYAYSNRTFFSNPYSSLTCMLEQQVKGKN